MFDEVDVEGVEADPKAAARARITKEIQDWATGKMKENLSSEYGQAPDTGAIETGDAEGATVEEAEADDAEGLPPTAEDTMDIESILNDPDVLAILGSAE